LVPMAERLSPTVVSALCAALDTGLVQVAREGVELARPARFALLLLDEGLEDETVHPALAERVAFAVDLEGVPPTEAQAGPEAPPEGPLLAEDAALEALAMTAEAFGVRSPRALLFALRAWRALGKGETALATAARLVIAPRATRVPEPPAPPDAAEEAKQPEGGAQEAPGGEAMADLLLDAVRAALPPGLLAAMAVRAPRGRGQGKGGERQGAARGAPRGSRAGRLARGERLALVDTLRAAAPWQRLRESPPGRISVRREDIRIRRFREKAETCAIFLVDASGSAAAERLAEAKGAVEQLLADAYVTRTEVALIAFRGRSADLLLPPTRSLTRAKRTLAALPGGGGTPLAHALEQGLALALAQQARGRSVQLVAMTDGRANIARSGAEGREAATADSLSLARTIRNAGVPCAVIDISARPRSEARGLADAMGARYLPLPRRDTGSVARAVRGDRA
ncbi:MAG: VWA domain-containing protein, partial [Sphingomonadaceae bacterium]